MDFWSILLLALLFLFSGYLLFQFQAKSKSVSSSHGSAAASKLTKKLGKKSSILLVGPKKSGKSYLLFNHLQNDPDSSSSSSSSSTVLETVPSMTSNQIGNIIDVPGCQLEQLDQFLAIAKAIVYVIDSVNFDPKSITESVYGLLAQSKIPITFMCNKQGFKSSSSVETIKTRLEHEL